MVDINNKKIENGHILAVRYAWNSYVGVVCDNNKLNLTKGAKRFQAFASQHSIEFKHTHQIIGSVDVTHPDYNAEVTAWFLSEVGDCPVILRVYDVTTVDEYYNHIKHKSFDGMTGYSHPCIKTVDEFVEDKKVKIGINDKVPPHATHVSSYYVKKK